MQQSVNDWLQEVFPPEDEPSMDSPNRFPAIRPIPPGPVRESGIVDDATAAAVSLAAVAAFVAEDAIDPEGKDRPIRVVPPFLGLEPPAYAMIMVAYLSARGNAIAKRLGRNPQEDLQRWFRQATLNYARESWHQPPAKADC